MTTSRFDPDDLLNRLAQAGVHVRLDDTGRLRLATPWPPDQTPATVRPLLRELRAHRAEVTAALAARRDAVVLPTSDTTPGPALRRARPTLPPILTVQAAPGARPTYPPTDWDLEQRYRADERMGMQRHTKEAIRCLKR